MSSQSSMFRCINKKCTGFVGTLAQCATRDEVWNEDHVMVLESGRTLKKGDVRPVPICPKCKGELAEEAR